MRTWSALLIVLSSMALLRALLSARGWLPGSPRRRSVRLVETVGLGGRQRLCVVEVDGERLLLGAGDASITVLRRLPPVPGETTADAAAPRPRAERPGRTPLRALRRIAPLLVLLVGCLAAAPAGAEPPAPESPTVPEIASWVGGATAPEGIASTLQVVALLTLISVAPSILLMATCFTRVVIVLAFLRQAIGVQQLPPTQVLVGLALFVTLFVMAPLGERIHAEALEPYANQEIDARMAAERAAVPVREFLVEYTREADLELFQSFRSDGEPEDPAAEVSLATLLPSYLLSELRTAFEIGFMLYLPFLVVDLVVASTLISMGMIVLPPIVISLPFKLMLFVLLDGWNLVIGSLLAGLS